MSGILFEYDALTDTTQKFYWDPVTERFTITDVQRVDDLLDMNQALRNTDAKANKSSMMRRVASVPLNIYMELKQKGIIDDPKKLREWLNNSDNRAWRTNDMKV